MDDAARIAKDKAALAGALASRKGDLVAAMRDTKAMITAMTAPKTKAPPDSDFAGGGSYL